MNSIQDRLGHCLGVYIEADRLERTIGPVISEYVGKHGLDEVKTALREWDENTSPHRMWYHSLSIFGDGSGSLIGDKDHVVCGVPKNSNVLALIREQFEPNLPPSCEINGKRYHIIYIEDKS